MQAQMPTNIGPRTQPSFGFHILSCKWFVGHKKVYGALEGDGVLAALVVMLG